MRRFAVEHGDAEVIARLRQRSAWAPAIGRRVVFLVARDRLARNASADREQPVSDRRRRHLPAHRRHRRFLRPRSGRCLRLRGSGGSKRSDDQTAGEQQGNDSDAAMHANLPCSAPASPARRDRRVHVEHVAGRPLRTRCRLACDDRHAHDPPASGAACQTCMCSRPWKIGSARPWPGAVPATASCGAPRARKRAPKD
jgi:hypothetical protein